ncbi:MAG TPA: phosphatase PAP2 family protein [Phycisphaerae bacterium]|nr:phosphatase PAP2 family protein [Phycisphaerae bacterium]
MRKSLLICCATVGMLLAAGGANAEEPTWLAIGEWLAQDAAGAEAKPAAPAAPAATGPRRGPAYPGDFLHSLGRDAKDFLPMMWDDAKATATNPFSLICLGLAGATGIALSGGNGNDQVQRHFERHGGQLNDFWDQVGDVGGNPGSHFGVAGAMYIVSMLNGDTKTYEVSKTMLSALALNGMTTLMLKAAARTESPNGDEAGWPSGHTSSTFCLATVLHEAYGPWVGVPAFAFAAFVGYERIDARNHDFSDVISGALIGIAIGHAVSQNHKPQIFGMDVIPYADPRGAMGIALVKQW